MANGDKLRAAAIHFAGEPGEGEQCGVNGGERMSHPAGDLSGRIAILMNPVSGTHQKDVVRLIAQNLQGPRRNVEVMETRAPGHIREIARTLAAQAILVAGGDGSVNEAVRGLLERPRPRPVLGIIPQGTASVLGYELGLPASAAGLAGVFLENRIGHLHIGLANGRPFVLMASAGFDAEVVKTVSLSLKEKIGGLAYVYAAAKACLRHDAGDIEVQTDQGAFLAKSVIITNAKHYGGNFVIDRNMSAVRPGLSLIAVSDVGLVSVLKLGLCLICGRLDSADIIRRMPVRRVRLRSRREIATQVDGDLLGSTPMVVSEGTDTIEVFIPSSVADAQTARGGLSSYFKLLSTLRDSNHDNLAGPLQRQGCGGRPARWWRRRTRDMPNTAGRMKNA
jgi:diacylglycerol kinase family enzyme